MSKLRTALTALAALTAAGWVALVTAAVLGTPAQEPRIEGQIIELREQIQALQRSQVDLVPIRQQVLESRAAIDEKVAPRLDDMSMTMDEWRRTIADLMRRMDALEGKARN